ncbi:MAG TPA: class I SAM-dependent methyltransferase [Gemmatimonadaceae bacterium]|nr:class I SAM-dependent methyltransferase [Gemmatimonadaceae bacterium]
MRDWDARFSEPGYAYGTDPNQFLEAVACQIPQGPVLCLAEGQGRNAAFLAGLGHRVTAMDQSAAGLARARELAQQKGVTIEFVHADLADFAIAPGAWAGIISIFAHVPQELRRSVHERVVAGLRPGGVFILEAYSVRQLTFGTGGPKDAHVLPTRDALEQELRGLDFVLLQEAERDVVEGRYHTGRAAVVQVLARKPA